MANIIAAGQTEAASSDITLPVGTPTTIQLNTGGNATLPADAAALIQYKNAGGGYNTIGRLTVQLPCQVLNAPGTFRVVRQACSANVAVDRD